MTPPEDRHIAVAARTSAAFTSHARLKPILAIVSCTGKERMAMSGTNRMLDLVQQGFHCSEILVLGGLEAQGKTNPDLVRAVSGLAGGLGFWGDVCGSLTGGACLLGLYAGKGTAEEEADERLNIMVSELTEWFAGKFGEKWGGIKCHEIIADNPGNRVLRCPEIVVSVHKKVRSLLAENGFDWSRGRPENGPAVLDGDQPRRHVPPPACKLSYK